MREQLSTQEIADADLAQKPDQQTFAKPGQTIRTQFFLFFLVSGFCSILYELVWLRLSMAQFGVTTAMISTVLSVFMAGLGAGSWAAGRLTKRIPQSSASMRLRVYALTELLIGVGSVAVPYELIAGRKLLEGLGPSSSLTYHVIAGLWLVAALIPWCTCMGATFPIAIWALRDGKDRERSFSYLYVANILGALGGTVLPLLIIEELGFHGTLRVGGILNLLLATWVFVLSARSDAKKPQPAPLAVVPDIKIASDSRLLALALLFATGLTSMGMEVVWIRLYTPYLGTQVYAFAAILGIYLASTFLGSVWYRRKVRSAEYATALFAVLGLAALLPLVTADPLIRFNIPHGSLCRVLLGISAFTALLGFITPMLVDRYSAGDPDKAGSGYAINVIGCILGPLLTGFVLLPSVGERWSLAILAGVWIVAGAAFTFHPSVSKESRSPLAIRLVFASCSLLSLLVLTFTNDFESSFKQKIVLRDSTATVIATAGTDGAKRLLINGVGITTLTPITKMMAHLPLAFLDHPPERALDICFGMGTTYRSLLTWGIHTEAAELVPSVPAVFHYYHPDAPRLLASPLGHIVVDDGRRYLERTQETYDLITIDPPPPIEAAGSSLLYSKEFYAVAKRRLRQGGILAQWLPYGDREVKASVTRAILESFAHVRIFGSIEGWGVHLLASDAPIPNLSAHELAMRLPEAARQDLIEWGPSATAEAQIATVLQKEVPPDDLIGLAPNVRALSDDRAVNEYNLLRNLRKRLPPSASASGQQDQ